MDLTSAAHVTITAGIVPQAEGLRKAATLSMKLTMSVWDFFSNSPCLKTISQDFNSEQKVNLKKFLKVLFYSALQGGSLGNAQAIEAKFIANQLLFERKLNTALIQAFIQDKLYFEFTCLSSYL